MRLGEYFKNGRPVLLTLVYYECPMLCNQILNSLTGTLTAMTFTPGKEFEVVTVSFDEREGPELAARKKETYLKRYKREGAGAGWHFLTGDKASIDALAGSVGFHYVWDEQSHEVRRYGADGRLAGPRPGLHALALKGEKALLDRIGHGRA